ncbi:MAG: hypothetical protein L3J45_04505 [Flavobacteriaceae bacterium]|nr:hypothetical protein [Flavobacteriaceae bacterium]
MELILKNEKIIFVILAIILLYSCDPGFCSDYIIKNNSSINIKLIFVGKTNDSKKISTKKEISLYGGAKCGMGSSSPVLYLKDNDSIYITNTSDEILKIYKQNTVGKNIYNADKYWTRTKPSKNFFEYTFEITDKDIGK